VLVLHRKFELDNVEDLSEADIVKQNVAREEIICGGPVLLGVQAASQVCKQQVSK
jgi:hypothetical protein